MTYTLVPFKPCPFIDNAIAEFTPGRQIECRWRLDGNIDAIRWPVVTDNPRRVHGLWHSTCFEWFLGPTTFDQYIEFNLSPSQDWNAFHFDGLRRGMIEASGIQPLSVVVHHGAREALIEAHIALDGPPPSPAHLGLSAVIEDTDGGLHYFALAHATATPDFHHPDNHVTLPAAES